MSEEIKPVVQEETADVEKLAGEAVETPEEKTQAVAEEPKEGIEEVKEAAVNLGEKTLAELSGLFQQLKESADRMKRSKEAEAIKSAFYKRLSKEKAEG